jgi:hypothetical protein
VTKIKELVSEYGRVAVATYLGLFVLVLAGFAVIFSFGFEAFMGLGTPESLQSVGVLGAAYAATKLAQPLRIGATLVLTPLVANLLKRRRGAKAEAE